MMKRILLIAILLIMLVGMNRPAQAQPMNMPLVMLINGDLWTWNPQTNALVQLTTWGYNFKPVMSPKGDWVAYKSWANVTVNAINANAPFNPGEPAGNIWLINPLTADALRIADQPADAVYGSPTGNDKFIARSNPVWSPDGSEMAWTEFLFPEYINRLVIYNMANKTTRVVVSELPIGYEQQGPADVVWGALGFAYLVFNYSADIDNFVETYHFYDENGRNYNTVTLPSGTSAQHGFFWFTGTSNSMDNGLAIVNSGELTKLLNPRTSSTVDFMGLIVAYSAWQSLTQGNYVSFTQYVDDVNFEYGLTWASQSSDGRYLGEIGISFSHFDTFSKMAIAPDGMSVAYIAKDGSVLVWQYGTTVELPVSNVEALAWSPTLWTTNYPVGG
ncbi:MAG: hypothetical protein CUN52_04690 [Phototrophicales bacterium]|jgi:hypothetical protein|nr:MAG: hypothetical protein CUN52_04690 [Phototrophicales bacterium]